MAITLLAVALFAPPTLPWYLTWGFVVASAFAWRRIHLAAMVAVSVFLVLVYYPTGEQSLYDWWFIIGVIAASLYGAASLWKPDPLGLVAAWRRRGDQFTSDTEDTPQTGRESEHPTTPTSRATS